MSRKKKTARPLPRWASALPDCRDPCFIQVGVSLMKHPAFQELSTGARWLYQCCMAESVGRMNFQLTPDIAALYGIPLRSMRRYVKELEEHGFIKTLRSGKNTRTASDYQFSFKWLEE